MREIIAQERERSQGRVVDVLDHWLYAIIHIQNKVGTYVQYVQRTNSTYRTTIIRKTIQNTLV